MRRYCGPGANRKVRWKFYVRHTPFLRPCNNANERGCVFQSIRTLSCNLPAARPQPQESLVLVSVSDVWVAVPCSFTTLSYKEVALPAEWRLLNHADAQAYG